MIGSRTIEIIAPAEAGTLLFESMNGREALGSLFEFHLDLLSDNGNIPLAKLLGKPFSVELNKGDSATALVQRHGRALRVRGWSGDRFQLSGRSCGRLMWLLTQVVELQDLPEQDHPRRHHGDLQGARHPGQEAPRPRGLCRVGVPGPVQRDRLQLRQPPHGAGGHLLLLHPRGGEAHRGAGRRADRPRHRSPATRSPVLSPPATAPPSSGEHEHIDTGAWRCRSSRRLRAKDFDFEKPRARSVDRSARTQQRHADVRVFDYPGEYLDERRARRLREAAARGAAAGLRADPRQRQRARHRAPGSCSR